MRSVENIYVVTMLLYMTGAIAPLLGGRAAVTQASVVQLAVQFPLYSVAFLFILLHRRTFTAAAMKMKWILGLTAVAVVSSAWSQVPLFTIRRSIILAATTAFGIYFGSRFDVDDQLRLLSHVFGIAICASIMFALFLPHYGLDNSLHRGAWQGVFAQKNGLGRAMVLSAIVFFFARLRAGRWVSWVGVIASLSLLYLSKSVTSAIVIIVISGVVLTFRLFRTRFTFGVPVFTLGGLILGVGILAEKMTSFDLLRYVHRDEGLSGRTYLWDLTLSAIARKPWFGYGFDSFWLGLQGSSATPVQLLQWSPPNSHNGFLDILLELGILGLSLFVVGYLLSWRRALRLLSRHPGHVPVWLCTYLFFLLLNNLSERTILDQNSIFWVLYVTTTVNIHRAYPFKVKAPARIQDAQRDAVGQSFLSA
jgi:exopolysaccharide production protein ExoQ